MLWVGSYRVGSLTSSRWIRVILKQVALHPPQNESTVTSTRRTYQQKTDKQEKCVQYGSRV